MTKKQLVVVALGVGLIALVVANCEGPAGPQGEPGPTGTGIIWKGSLAQAPADPDTNWAYYNTADYVSYIYDGEFWDTLSFGAPGSDGADGVDMNSCAACHNDSTRLLAMQLQYGASTHALGTTFARNSASCAACHTHEGYMLALSTGKIGKTVSVAPSDPTPPNCRTCHPVHTNFDVTDYGLRAPVDTVTMNLTSERLSLGKGAVCAHCHQPRTSYPVPTPDASDSVALSDRYGPHHSVQATVLAGSGGFEYPGSEAYASTTVPDHYRTADDACVTCHMAAAVGALSGGHTMKVSYESHGEMTMNTAGCVACHDDAATLTAMCKELETEFDSLLNELEAILIADNLIVADSATGETVVAKDTVSANQAGAVWNYVTVKEDGSRGMHNPVYVKALLKNTIEMLRP